MRKEHLDIRTRPMEIIWFYVPVIVLMVFFALGSYGASNYWTCYAGEWVDAPPGLEDDIDGIRVFITEQGERKMIRYYIPWDNKICLFLMWCRGGLSIPLALFIWQFLFYRITNKLHYVTQGAALSKRHLFFLCIPGYFLYFFRKYIFPIYQDIFLTGKKLRISWFSFFLPVPVLFLNLVFLLHLIINLELFLPCGSFLSPFYDVIDSSAFYILSFASMLLVLIYLIWLNDLLATIRVEKYLKGKMERDGVASK